MATKKVAVVHLSNTLKLARSSSKLTSESILFYVRSILELYSKYVLEPSIIDQLDTVFVTLLSPDLCDPLNSTKERNKQAAPGYIDTVVSYLMEALKVVSTTRNSLYALLSCTTQILNVMLEYSNLGETVNKLLNAIEVIIEEEIVSIMNEVKAMAEKKGDVNEIKKKMNNLTKWLKMNTILFSSARFNDLLVLKYYVYSQTLISLLLQCIQFRIPVAGEAISEFLLSFTRNPELDKSINEMKSCALEFLSEVLNYIYSTPLATKANTTHWFALCGLLGPIILFTLLKLCLTEYDELEERLADKCISNLVSRFLRIFYNMLEDNSFYQFFSDNKSKLFVDIILILLKVTTRERELLTTDPQEFVALALDTCDKQNSNIPKTEAAKVLESLCDHVDGTLTFVAYFCCEALQCAAKGKTIEDYKENVILKQFASTSLFLIKSTQEEIIETCLMAMTDISYLTPSRKDVFLLFENVLTENYTAIFSGSSPLISCRVALALGYYLDKLFMHNPELFLSSIEFLVKGLALENKEKAFTLQCVDTLKTTIADNDMITRISDCINRFFPYLTSLVEHVQQSAVFEIFKSIIHYYGRAISVSVIPLLDALVLRIQIELKSLKEKGEKNNIIINSCWNIIAIICDSDAFYPQLAGSIENSMLPLFNYLMNPDEVEFDDDIIKAVGALIRRHRGISPNMVKVFPVLPKTYEKSKGVFGNLLEVLNYYLYYGKDLFIQDKTWIEILLTMANTSLFLKVEPVEENNAEGALLIQMTMQTLGNGILDPYIPTILQAIMKRLSEKIIENYLKIQLYSALLCTICNNGPLALQTIQPQLGVIINDIMVNAKKFTNSYNRKVLAVGLSNILIHCSVPEFARDYYSKILEVIVQTLKTQKEEDLKAHIKEDKQVITLEESDDSSESSSDEDDETNIEMAGSEDKV